MTIVRAYFGGKLIDPPENPQLISSTIHALLVEGIAQNTTGNVFVPEVGLLLLDSGFIDLSFPKGYVYCSD